MIGYPKNKASIKKAVAGERVTFSDLGVKRAGGHVELRDCAEDIMISRGDYISPVEVEGALFNPPALQLAGRSPMAAAP